MAGRARGYLGRISSSQRRRSQRKTTRLRIQDATRGQGSARWHHKFQLLCPFFSRLNCTHPPLSDVHVRRALSPAIDREQLTRRVIQSETAGFAFLPPNCADDTAGRSVSLNVAEVRRLVAAAGFPEGRGFPRLELLSFSGSLLFGSTPEAVQAMGRATSGSKCP